MGVFVGILINEKYLKMCRSNPSRPFVDAFLPFSICWGKPEIWIARWSTWGGYASITSIVIERVRLRELTKEHNNPNQWRFWGFSWRKVCICCSVSVESDRSRLQPRAVRHLACFFLSVRGLFSVVAWGDSPLQRCAFSSLRFSMGKTVRDIHFENKTIRHYCRIINFETKCPHQYFWFNYCEQLDIWKSLYSNQWSRLSGPLRGSHFILSEHLSTLAMTLIWSSFIIFYFVCKSWWFIRRRVCVLEYVCLCDAVCRYINGCI